MTNNTQQFGSYMAGLFEGDGHICLPYVANKKSGASFNITFHKKDLVLAENLLSKLQTYFNFKNGCKSGTIRHKTKENACVLTIRAFEALKISVSLIDGQLRTPKIYQVNCLIDWLNKHHNACINSIDLCTSSINSNAWLARFIDADTSFCVQYTKAKPGTKRLIRCRFRLEQRRICPKTGQSYEPILKLIANFFCVKLNLRSQHKTQRIYYIIDLSSVNSRRIITNYLDQYVLRSSKYLDYKLWRKAGIVIAKKTQFTATGLRLIEHVRAHMNNNRTDFDWGHLDQL